MKHWHSRAIWFRDTEIGCPGWGQQKGGLWSMGEVGSFQKGQCGSQFSYSVKSSASSQMWGSPLTFNLLRLLTETGLTLEIWLSSWFLWKHAKNLDLDGSALHFGIQASSISIRHCRSHAAQCKVTPFFTSKPNDFNIPFPPTWKDSSLDESFSGKNSVILCGKGGWKQHFEPVQEISRTVIES